MIHISGTTIMFPYFTRFWNSVEEVGRAVYWSQQALIFLGLIVVFVTFAQYKLGQRKDQLNDATQKREQVILNEEVARASGDAATGLKELAKSKAQILQLNDELMFSARETQRALEEVAVAKKDLIAAQSDLSLLRARSERIASLRMRVEISATSVKIEARNQAGAFVLSGLSQIASYGTLKSINFQSAGGYVIPQANSEVLLTTTADANEADIVGKDISLLNQFGWVGFDLPGFLSVVDHDQKYKVGSVTIYMVINGESIRVISWDNISDQEARSTMRSFNAYAAFSQMKRRYEEAVDRQIIRSVSLDNP